MTPFLIVASNVVVCPVNVIWMCFFLWWALHHIFSYILPKGHPIIRRTMSLEMKDGLQLSHTSKQSQLKHENIHIRMTRRFDSDGTYRITDSASFRFTKCILRLFGCIISVTCLSSSWYYRHFVLLDSNTNSFWAYQVLVAISFSEFACEWAISTSQFATQKTDYALDVHHILSTLVAILIMNDIYIPFATLFGIITEFWLFIAHFAIGFRIEFYDKYPNTVRLILKCATYYTICLIVVNMLCVYGFIFWAFMNTE
eukprot:62765_1